MHIASMMAAAMGMSAQSAQSAIDRVRDSHPAESFAQFYGTSGLSLSGYHRRRAKRPTVVMTYGKTVKKRRRTGFYRARQSKNRRRRS
jgi:hypothetical protein